MRAHARHGQAAARISAVGEIAATAPIWISHHRLTADLVEGDILCGMPGRSRDRQRREHAVRIARRPLQHLHASHRAARHRKQRLDAEIIEQHRLGADHVAHSNDRKVETPRHSGCRIGRSRPGTAHAAADDIGADNEIALGVDRLAGPDHGLPPTRLAGHRMIVDGVLVAGQRMANQYRIAACGIERAVGLIGNLQRAKIEPGVEVQWIARRKANDRRMRIVRLARAVGQIERGADIGHRHCLARRASRRGPTAEVALKTWRPKPRK